MSEGRRAGVVAGLEGDLPVVGDIRVAHAAPDASDDDAGAGGKLRPALVVRTDDDAGQAGIRFIHGTHGAVRREGRVRRLVDWRAAGLHKPSLVDDDETTVDYSDLGERKGTVSERDLRRILG